MTQRASISRQAVLVTLLISTYSVGRVLSTPSPECDCYLISGPNPGYFTHHRFWDFRAIPSTSNNNYTFAPPLITSAEDQGNENVTSPFFNSSAWEQDWTIQSWTQPSTPSTPIKSVNSPQNIYISRNTTPGAESATYLTLRASCLPDFMSIAELDSNEINILHASVRARMRVIPNGLANAPAPPASTAGASSLAQADAVVAGAVLGLFTYNSSTSESDIEILTRDPEDRIRYSNQPDYDALTDTSVPGASTEALLPSHYLWTEWLEHRLDWTPALTRWWVDGQLALEKGINVPRNGSGLILNLWGDGGVWSGNMTVGEVVTAGVEWIEVAFNVSGDAGGRCQVGCKVDGVQMTGEPELAFNVTGMSSGCLVRGMGKNGRWLFGWIVTMTVCWQMV